ncbi:MAG: rod shape-determining protein RodA [Ruminococcaceae bacterium]|nr:rod shape-determining protein RodA [Oscillospiraceae bacterium]
MRKKATQKTPFDYVLFTLCMAVTILGIAMIFSAAGFSAAVKQTIAMVVGAGCMYFVLAVPNRFYHRFWWVFFLINLILLGLTLYMGIGREETGGQSWLVLGPVRFQPGELVKMGFIISFAAHVDTVKENINRFSVILILLLHAGVIIGLILAQPDAGTALVFLFITISMMYAAGLHYTWLIAGGLVSLGAFPFVWMNLQTYQKERIFTFLQPERDPLGYGYQVIQSKTAISGGGLYGHGYLHGVLTQSDALPAKHTDFLFAVLGEELGFWGCMLIMILLLTIILRVFLTAKVSKTSFGTIVCAGIGAMLLFHTFENIGMCMGLMPVTGIPLPFFSYGGTALVTVFIGIGLVMNARYRTSAESRRK